MRNPISWLAARICRVEDNYPILPLMFFVHGYRTKYGLMVRNPTWRPVCSRITIDGAYFAPRAIAWLYRLLPLVFQWSPPEPARGGWLGPFVGSYSWHVGYVRASQTPDKGPGYFVAMSPNGYAWSSRQEREITAARLDGDGLHVEHKQP